MISGTFGRPSVAERAADRADDVVARVRLGRRLLVARVDHVVALAGEVRLPRLELLARVLAEPVQKDDDGLRLPLRLDVQY